MAEGGDHLDEEPQQQPLPPKLPGVQLDEPNRRYSDNTDPRPNPGNRASLALPGASPCTTQRSASGRRCRSASGTLEQQMGQELRRISDEFHLSYQTRPCPIPARVHRDSSPGPAHPSSLPEPRRRGSIVERFMGLFSTSSDEGGVPNAPTDVTNNDVFVTRRRAHSEILMASGVTPDMFGRQELLLSAGSRVSNSSEHESGHSARLTSEQNCSYDEVDNSYIEDSDDHGGMFHLSTDDV